MSEAEEQADHWLAHHSHRHPPAIAEMVRGLRADLDRLRAERDAVIEACITPYAGAPYCYWWIGGTAHLENTHAEAVAAVCKAMGLEEKT